MNSLQLISEQKEVSLTELTGQITKDLSLAGIDTTYFENVKTGEVLLEKLQYFIQDILSHHQTDFDRFMYRVDVPEKEFSGVMTTNFDVLIDRIVFLVLKREMQKLIFRKQFGQ